MNNKGKNIIMSKGETKISDCSILDNGNPYFYTNDENSTIGIIICKDKKDAIVEMTLPEDNNQIFASKYETVLPSKEELQKLSEKTEIIF